jgi:hypothetical protein
MRKLFIVRAFGLTIFSLLVLSKPTEAATMGMPAANRAAMEEHAAADQVRYGRCHGRYGRYSCRRAYAYLPPYPNYVPYYAYYPSFVGGFHGYHFYGHGGFGHFGGHGGFGHSGFGGHGFGHHH